MAESFKVTKDGKEGLLEAAAVFPDLVWGVNRGTGEATIFDAKARENVPVHKGDFIVSIADRYEVADEEPAKAKPVEAPKAPAKTEEKATETKAAPAKTAPSGE